MAWCNIQIGLKPVKIWMGVAMMYLVYMDLKKEFRVNENQMDLLLRRVCCEHGMGEHKDYEVCVIVNKVG